jgi:hypothetical protein
MLAVNFRISLMRQMYLITLSTIFLKSGVRLLVEILITACKLMSVKEHLYLLLLILKQEKLRSCTGRKSRFKADFSDSLGGPQKEKLLAGRMWLAGRYLPPLVYEKVQT